ncbi:hypothetical protein TNCV_1263111 [Trichonephila clavipes]|nr:hypothetical protein TNCV_1263111 [Trichonephila clavipes]
MLLHSWWDPSEWILCRRSNLELYKIYKQLYIVKFVKLQTLKWAGHLARMNEDRCCKKIFLAKPLGNRPWGRPPLYIRWSDCAKKDLNSLKVSKTGKQLPKVEMPEENFWSRTGLTQGRRSIEEEEECNVIVTEF